jgi:TPR repeat protein
MDVTEAVRYYRLAADLGLANAQGNLGLCYENGWGVAKDETEAAQYYRLAADQGFANAQFNLGECY